MAFFFKSMFPILKWVDSMAFMISFKNGRGDEGSPHSFFQKFIFIYVYAYPMCARAHRGQKMVLDSPELELAATCYVLGTKLQLAQWFSACESTLLGIGWPFPRDHLRP